MHPVCRNEQCLRIVRLREWHQVDDLCYCRASEAPDAIGGMHFGNRSSQSEASTRVSSMRQGECVTDVQ
jgi:hypothetical protein